MKAGLDSNGSLYYDIADNVDNIVEGFGNLHQADLILHFSAGFGIGFEVDINATSLLRAVFLDFHVPGENYY